jgi:folate-binding protein YgfZ
MTTVFLPHRGVVKIIGEGARDFLQGVITADMRKVAPDHPVHAALLSAQGKVLVDFLLIEAPASYGGGFLADVPLNKADELVTILNRYKLRAKAIVENISAVLAVSAIWDDSPVEGGLALFRDPREPNLGWRFFGAKPPMAQAPEDLAAYEAHRIACGVPEAGQDFTYGDIYAHEMNMDAEGSLSFDKGCYVGQEIVARMQMRKLTRSRLVKVRLEGAEAAPGTDVTFGGKMAGRMGSALDGAGLALLRLDMVDEARAKGGTLSAEGARLIPV